MVRVNQLQLESIKRFYPQVRTVSTRHSIYVIAFDIDAAAIMRAANGRPSNRQRDAAETNMRRQKPNTNFYSAFMSRRH